MSVKSTIYFRTRGGLQGAIWEGRVDDRDVEEASGSEGSEGGLGLP